MSKMWVLPGGKVVWMKVWLGEVSVSAAKRRPCGTSSIVLGPLGWTSGVPAGRPGA